MANPIPSNLREFDDTTKTRELIYGNTLAAVQKRFPVEDDEYRLELNNPHYAGPQTYTLQQQKEALMKDRRLHTPVVGTWRLIHKPTNQLIEEREDTVMHVPYYTDRGTFIRDGNEYSVTAQQRLKPGVYVRKQRTGEIEAHFNVQPGTGKAFRLHLEPESGVFKVNVGQSNIPAYPLLRAMGVTDKQMTEQWGADLVAANAKARSDKAIDKMYERFSGYKFDPTFTEEAKLRYLRESLPTFKLDPAVTGRTMGLPHEGVTPELLLRATQKMLHVSKGEAEADDRDAPMFSNFLGVEDHMAERVDKDAGKLSQNLFRRVRRGRSLKPLQRGVLNSYVDSLMLGSGLAQPLEETNVMHTFEQLNRITKMGQGGIGSSEAVTDEARDVNPGQVGFIDTIAGPEGCHRGDAEVMTNRGWMRWDTITSDTVFACMMGGQLEYHKASELHVYDWDGLLYGAKTKHIAYLVTPNHRLWVRPSFSGAEYRYETAETVHGTLRNIRTGGHEAYAGNGLFEFTLPDVDGGNAMKHHTAPIPGRLWGAFMGWYLSEGSTHLRTDGNRMVAISQHDGETIDELTTTLNALPFNWSEMREHGNLHGYTTACKQLYEYLKPFGGSHDKYIPEYFFFADVETRQALLRTLCLGDGRRKRDTYTYCTTSIKLALGVERLAFSLGYAVTVRFERDERPQALTGGTWCVHLHKRVERTIHTGNKWRQEHYYTEHHVGKVYCATVPGGLLYCRNGSKGGHWSGNSNIGIDTRAAYRTFKGNDHNIYGEFHNPKSGKMEYLRPDQTYDRTVAFPGGMAKGGMVQAMRSGKLVSVPAKEVDYEVPSLGHLYSSHINMNPMPTGMQAGRSFYAAKYWSQYLPMKEGDVPLVDSLMDDGKTTYSEYYGRKSGTLKADKAGKVVKVTDDGITIQDANGDKHTVETIKDLPFNRLTAISYFPTVQVGDEVKPGQMIAHSNFTDKKTGALNLGRNLKVAVVPARGNSFEDAYTISETAAKKLSSERLYGFDLEAKHGIELGHNRYISAFPRTFTKEQLSNVDEHGVVKTGTILQKGDPIILATGPKLLSSADAQLGKLHKVLRSAYTDKSQVWENSWPGVVVDTAMVRSGAKVNIKSTPPVAVGDKLASSYSIKGVVGRIVEDDKMPRDHATNEPYEVLFNPMTILSRVAPNQIVDIALGKLAKHTGQQIRLPQQPPPEGWAKWAQGQLEAAKLKDSADLFDPESGKTIRNVGDGFIHMHAFHHLAEKKLSQRGEQGGFSADEQPSKGGSSGAKRFSQLDVNAALAHGATDVIKDALVVRGTKNEDYWKALKLGRPIPEPGIPLIYTKFLNSLRAGGINVSEKGDTTQLLPMTDADMDQLSHGEIDKADMLDDNFEPLKGGLFDVGKTGGTAGKHWTTIRLPEPLPNPVMEEPVRRLLGLKIQQMEDILAGTEKLNGKTGGLAIQDALQKINIDDMIQEHKQKIRTTRGAARDNRVKILGYLSIAKEQDIHPSKWMINKVPVLPPAFRPISRMGDVALTADMNELYRDLLESSKTFTTLRKDLPDESLATERLSIYNAVKAAYGLGDPITPEGQSKRIKGAVRQVIGDSPKYGMFQSKVISKPVSGVGRGVVTPDPNLDMDQIGIPADSAWELYKDHVMRRLVRRGYPAIQASEMITKRDRTAREMLDEEMADRPVIVDRAPTWHKFNLMAFYPHIVEGHTVRVCPLITKAYTMDFDGDTVNFHVPAGAKAVEDTKHKMLPSRNLFSLTDLKSVRHSPSMEMISGLFELTKPASNKPVRTFRTTKEAEAAYRAGEIKPNDPIEVLELKS